MGILLTVPKSPVNDNGHRHQASIHLNSVKLRRKTSVCKFKLSKWSKWLRASDRPPGSIPPLSDCEIKPKGVEIGGIISRMRNQQERTGAYSRDLIPTHAPDNSHREKPQKTQQKKANKTISVLLQL